jgi:hypothetical protein
MAGRRVGGSRTRWQGGEWVGAGLDGRRRVVVAGLDGSEGGRNRIKRQG